MYIKKEFDLGKYHCIRVGNKAYPELDIYLDGVKVANVPLWDGMVEFIYSNRQLLEFLPTRERNKMIREGTFEAWIDNELEGWKKSREEEDDD